MAKAHAPAPAKTTIDQAVAADLDEAPGPAAEAPEHSISPPRLTVPVEAAPLPAAVKARMVKPLERAPAGLHRFRVNAPNHGHGPEYVLAAKREDAEAEYRAAHGLAADVTLSVVALAD